MPEECKSTEGLLRDIELFGQSNNKKKIEANGYFGASDTPQKINTIEQCAVKLN